MTKFRGAERFFTARGTRLEQLKLHLDEIQSDNGADIALAKVRAAFAQQPTPLFVNDASWLIPALNGFPGAYMKYIYQWLNAGDLLRLMDGKADRSIILKDFVAYKDGDREQVFSHEVRGQILTEARGDTIRSVIVMEGSDTVLSELTTEDFLPEERKLWEEFANAL